MKTWKLAIGLLLGSATLSYGYYGWGIYGAYWDTSDGDGAGGAGLKVSVEMVPGVQMELRGTFFEEVDNDADLEVLPLEAGLALAIPLEQTDLEVLAGGGVGYYLMDADTSVDDEFGYYFSAGMEWNFQPRAALFGEAVYRFVSVDDVGAGGSDADLDGIGFNAGVLIKW